MNKMEIIPVKLRKNSFPREFIFLYTHEKYTTQPSKLGSEDLESLPSHQKEHF